MNFKEFTTLLKEGVQKLTPDEEAQIIKLTADLWNNWRLLPEEKIKKLKKNNI